MIIASFSQCYVSLNPDVKDFLQRCNLLANRVKCGQFLVKEGEDPTLFGGNIVDYHLLSRIELEYLQKRITGRNVGPLTLGCLRNRQAGPPRISRRTAKE